LNSTRRSFLKKAVYVAPAVMTMTALPAIASNGSGISEYPEITVIAEPNRWQSRERRNSMRRERLKNANSDI
jgi:hypothetical protein